MFGKQRLKRLCQVEAFAQVDKGGYDTYQDGIKLS